MLLFVTRKSDTNAPISNLVRGKRMHIILASVACLMQIVSSWRSRASRAL